MSSHRRPFRIEVAEPPVRPGKVAANGINAQLDRLFDELADLRRRIEQLTSAEAAVVPPPGPRGTNVMEPWASVDDIYEAYSTTRSEIAALRAKGVTDPSRSRATDELDAVVSDTETATETILASAEEIDQIIATLSSRISGHDQTLASEIQDHVIRIFEACNFQDISGQRISKVVGLLQFIEMRLQKMEQVWNAVSSFDSEGDLCKAADINDESSLLNGPALKKDSPVSQDEIDSLFR